MRVDIATEERTRAKFARLFMEIDLSKPLISKFRMRRRIWRLEYEGMHLVYFYCDKYGHKMESCLSKIQEKRKEEANMEFPHHK